LKNTPGTKGYSHVDIETGERYWLSGVKRNREDRHSAGRGPIQIDDDVREEYERLVEARH
jgi:hypothetical protein